MIFLAPHLLQIITQESKKAYPFEACGLLVGHQTPDNAVIITKVVQSKNVTNLDKRHSFEIDPQTRFDTMRNLSDKNNLGRFGKKILGHYHSHPDQPAQPSETDLAMVYEPELIWIITSINKEKIVNTTAHIFDSQIHNFRELALRISN